MNGRMVKQIRKQSREAFKQNLYHWILWAQDLQLGARWSIAWRLLFRADSRGFK